MPYCILYINISISPVIFSPAEYYSTNGEYRKVPCYLQRVAYMNYKKINQKNNIPDRKTSCNKKRSKPTKDFCGCKNIENDQITKPTRKKKKKKTTYDQILAKLTPIDNNSKESLQPIVEVLSGDEQRLNKVINQCTEKKVMKPTQKKIVTDTTSYDQVLDKSTPIDNNSNETLPPIVEVLSGDEQKLDKVLELDQDTKVDKSNQNIDKKEEHKKQVIKSKKVQNAVISSPPDIIEVNKITMPVNIDSTNIANHIEADHEEKVKDREQVSMKKTTSLKLTSDQTVEEIPLPIEERQIIKQAHNKNKNNSLDNEVINTPTCETQRPKVVPTTTLCQTSDHTLCNENKPSNDYLHLSIYDSLSLGDRISVYDKDRKIDTGRFVFIGNTFFLWTDSDGHIRIQLIDGSITIKKH